MTIIISWNGRCGPRRYQECSSRIGPSISAAAYRRGNHVQGLKTASESCFGEGEETFEFGLGSEPGCNPDGLRVELAGYWSRLLVRVKEQSEVVEEKKVPEELRS